jgi:hypothetical protein
MWPPSSFSAGGQRLMSSLTMKPCILMRLVSTEPMFTIG